MSLILDMQQQHSWLAKPQVRLNAQSETCAVHKFRSVMVGA